MANFWKRENCFVKKYIKNHLLKKYKNKIIFKIWKNVTVSLVKVEVQSMKSKNRKKVPNYVSIFSSFSEELRIAYTSAVNFD